MGQDHRIPQKPRPRVGVTYRRLDKLRAYVEAVEKAGMEAVPIHPDDPLPLDGLDGLLLSGGTDLNPQMYGADPHPASEAPDNSRDALERRLLQDALQRDLPVLCICRGMQLFNVIHGGTLIQDMEGHRIPDVSEAHSVDVSPGTKLAEVLDAGAHPVNSRHHQVIGELGQGLCVSATSPDGQIEAIERSDKRFAVAVQWHPEELVNDQEEAKRLFAAFAQAASHSR